ncbi:ultraviolet-B receptor UVR8-like [Dendronephthya gigantea]|uniref:ultraviolet-B receptor UVR8-like n=1 Tax=Dendronephthya gigantea TaxID=151771 RepID=UPI00106B1070|nr:ultraviolet-B receptor UVR8-like [Dendronephthya gigantea]
MSIMAQNNYNEIPAEIINAIFEMSKGSSMLLIGKLNRPCFRTFVLSKDLVYLHWQAPREKSSVLISQITQVLDGKTTTFFKTSEIPEDFKVLSISVLYSTDQGEESLNFICEGKKDYDTWLTGLKALANGIEDKELLQELITGDEDNDTSVHGIVSKLNGNSSMPRNRTTGNGTGGHSTTSVRYNAELCDLYTWGDGTRSKLGHGEEIEEHRPRMVNALSRLNMKLVSCGANHMLCVTDSGETLSWGSGSKGQLGQGHLRDRFTPLRVEALQQQNVVQISCNQYHSAAVTDEGKLYTWGYGSIKLGYETGNEKQLTPKVVQSLGSHRVVHASCGKDFTMACTSDGQLFAFGNNKFYQLGLGDSLPRREPTLVEFENINDESMVKVECGDYHTAVMSDWGNVWMWGANEYGQLGTGDDFAMFSKPCKLQISEDNSSITLITNISCGSRHSALVTFDGLLYCFGDNTFNQLGKKNTTDGPAKCNKPERIKLPLGVRIKRVSCGAYHSAAVSEEGEIFTWGNGSDGKLGHGDLSPRFQPTQILECFEGKRVTSVSCGFAHSACTAAIRSERSLVKKCMACLKKFSIIQNRCRCHRCNGTFCSSCAPRRPVRLCDKCFKIMADQNP